MTTPKLKPSDSPLFAKNAMTLTIHDVHLLEADVVAAIAFIRSRLKRMPEEFVQTRGILERCLEESTLLRQKLLYMMENMDGSD